MTQLKISLAAAALSILAACGGDTENLLCR